MSQDVPALVIQELNGYKRRLVLTERAVSFRPLPFEGTQNVEVTWYPGYPVATAQPLGPQESSTTIRGAWHDRFLGVVVGRETPAMVNDSPVPSAAELVEILDSIRILGSEIRFSWHIYNRVGYLTRVSANWLTIHDVEWEAEFTWTRRGDVFPPQLRAAATIPVLPEIYSAQAALLDAINESPLGAIRSGLRNASNATATFFSGVNDTVGAALGSVADGVQALAALSQSLALGTTAYSQAMRQTAGVLAGVQASYTTAAAAVDELVVSSVVTAGAVLSVGERIALAASLTSVANAMRSASRTALEQREAVQAAIQPAPDEIYTARDGDDLRRVCTLYFGAPDSWIDLARYNGLTVSTLEAGQTVRVPPGGFESSGVALG
jgi:hypothetical protein